jgi:hypothetical protein
MSTRSNETSEEPPRMGECGVGVNQCINMCPCQPAPALSRVLQD